MTTDAQKVEIDVTKDRLGRLVAELETLAARELPKQSHEDMVDLRDRAVAAHHRLVEAAKKHGSEKLRQQFIDSIAQRYADRTSAEIRALLEDSDLSLDAKRRVIEETLTIRRSRVVCDGASPSPGNVRTGVRR